jgi:hypothetical protein
MCRVLALLVSQTAEDDQATVQPVLDRVESRVDILGAADRERKELHNAGVRVDG